MPDTTRDLIFPTPIFHEKIWGGRKLADDFGYEIPDGPIGECWAISAHPNGDCAISGGAWDGMRLSELWDQHRELFGGVEGDRFPLLVKIIDAKDNLSVQVHPDDAYAAKHENGSLGKRECWYVLAADEGTQIVIGQRAHDRAELASMIDEGAGTTCSTSCLATWATSSPSSRAPSTPSRAAPSSWRRSSPPT